MLPGELVMRPLELPAPAGYEFTNRPVAGGLSQLHVLIPKVPCQPIRAVRLRLIEISANNTSADNFLLSFYFPVSQIRVRPRSGHDCHIGCIDGLDGRVGTTGFESDTMWDETCKISLGL